MRRRVLGAARVATVIGILTIGSGCDRSGEPSRPEASGEAAAREALVARGEMLFAKHCAICHGENGDGQGRFAYLMNPQPRNFLDAKFKLTTTMNQVPTDEDLLRTIRRGMPGSAMPPWSHLPEADLTALAAYVRHLGNERMKARIQEDLDAGILTEDEAQEEITAMTLPGAPVPVPPELPFDEESWFQGRRVYLEACAACHGQDGEPDPNAELKQDEYGYPVSPRSFVRGVFKGGSAGDQLYARLFKGMRGTPMPGYEGTYPEERLWDLVHYIQSLAQAGSQERAWLRRGTITAKAVAGDELPDDPTAAEWNQAPPTYVSLTPLWWRHDRIEGLLVQALHDTHELALRLSWLDPVADEQAVRVQDFRDGVAIQFSATPDPPFYMGQPGPEGGVTLWYWKADRQTDLLAGYQDEGEAYPAQAVDLYPAAYQTVAALATIQPEMPAMPIAEQDATYLTGWGAGNLVSNPKLDSPVEVLEARGPGTLSARPIIDQVVHGQGVHEKGVWYVQMKRSLTPPPKESSFNGATQIRFRPGDRVPLSFAVWDGHTGDRDGKKQISIWQELVIE